MVPVRLLRFATVMVLAALALTLRASAAHAFAADEELSAPPAEILAEADADAALVFDSISTAQSAPVVIPAPGLPIVVTEGPKE